MIPLIQEEVVGKKKWLTTDEFMDMFAVIQSAPGLIAINSAIFIGYKTIGIKGAIVATLGASLPSFFIILGIAAFFSNFREIALVQAIFKGVRPAVVALIAGAVYKLGKPLEKNGIIILLFIVSLTGIVWLGIHPILLILGSALLGIFLPTYRGFKGGDKS